MISCLRECLDRLAGLSGVIYVYVCVYACSKAANIHSEATQRDELSSIYRYHHDDDFVVINNDMLDKDKVDPRFVQLYA